MIEARTYLRPHRALVPLEDVREPPQRINYIDGAIELAIDGTPILTIDEVDLVDQLWAYLVNGAIEIAAGRDWQTMFPDQAIELAFALDAATDRVTVTLSYRGLPAPRRAPSSCGGSASWRRACSSSSTRSCPTRASRTSCASSARSCSAETRRRVVCLAPR